MKQKSLNAYYLDDQLTESEVAEVEELTGFGMSQLRIPHVLPTAMPDETGALRMPPGSDDAPLAALKAAGILKDSGRRVFLVAPLEAHWNSRFADAIGRLTGHWPYLVQTSRERDAIGNPGSLRVLDLDAAMG
jgi:hypothetical protein